MEPRLRFDTRAFDLLDLVRNRDLATRLLAVGFFLTLFCFARATALRDLGPAAAGPA
jgi:hypothetical protein